MTAEQHALFQPERYANDLEQDERRNPLEILEFLDIRSGDVIVDLFAGGGYFSELFDTLVEDKGKVYVQNHPAFVRLYTKELDKRLSNNRLRNTQRIDSTYADLQLPSNVDLIFISLAYHDIYVSRKNPDDNADPASFYSQVYEALKPGGELVIIDHSGVVGTGNTKTNELHRIDEKWTRENFEAAGFEFISESNALRNPDDQRILNVWDKKVFHNTDRFIHKYLKPVK